MNWQKVKKFICRLLQRLDQAWARGGEIERRIDEAKTRSQSFSSSISTNNPFERN